MPCTPSPLETLEVLDTRKVADLVPRAGRDRLRDRMLGRIFERPGQAQHLVGLFTAGRDHVQQRHRAGGHRARLVQDDGVDAAGGLEHFGALDQDAQLGSAAGADQQRGRRGQP